MSGNTPLVILGAIVHVPSVHLALINLLQKDAKAQTLLGVPRKRREAHAEPHEPCSERVLLSKLCAFLFLPGRPFVVTRQADQRSTRQTSACVLKASNLCDDPRRFLVQAVDKGQRSGGKFHQQE